MLSIVFPLAYEENETLENLVVSAQSADGTSYDPARLADLTSFLAVQLAVATSFLTVMLSSRLYTQLAFWMPTLDAQLWFVNESASSMHFLETAKNVTLFATLLTLSLETAVTATWYDGIAYVPLAILVVGFVCFERNLSSKCKERLGRELHQLVDTPNASLSS